MKQSKMMKEVLTILNNKPDKALTLFCIAEDMKKAEGFNRKSSLRASLSRCLNRMKKEGIVTYQYKTKKVQLGGRQDNMVLCVPEKFEGKFWSIATENSPEPNKKPIAESERLKELKDNFLTVEQQPQIIIPDLTEQTFEPEQNTKDTTVNIVKEDPLLVEDDPLAWGKNYRETVIQKM